MNSFSIIVPVYNVEKYLKKCLDSLVNQDYDNYEIIIVNDGSLDNSDLIINEYKKQYPNLIKKYDKKNGGLSSARNYGIKKATKDFLLFVDSDDHVETNTLNILNKELSKEIDILVYNYKAIYKDYSLIINTFNNNIKRIDSRFLLGSPSACNKVFKRTLFIDNNLKFTEDIYYEDLATIPKLINYTLKIKFINNSLYNYVVREDSITNKKNYNKKMNDIFMVVDNLKKELPQKYKEEIEFIYIEHLLRNAGLRFINYEKYDKINQIVNIMKKEFPNWRKNKYYKKIYNIKQKIISLLIYKKSFLILSILRYKVGK